MKASARLLFWIAPTPAKMKEHLKLLHLPSPCPAFQLSVEDDLLLSSSKAGVTVSIITLAVLNRCLAAVGVPREAVV